MADVAANQNIKTRGHESNDYEVIADATKTLYAGTAVGLKTGPTATGKAELAATSKTLTFIGFAQRKVTGHATNSVFVEVDHGPFILKNLTVAGTPALTDAWKSLVYVTENFTFTKTRPSTGAQILGIIVAYHTSGKADVLLFHPGWIAAGIAAGGARVVRYLGSMELANLATGNIVIGEELHGRGLIKEFYVIVETVTTDADADATLNCEIDGTDITGGVVTLDDTGGSSGMDTLGTKIAGTAITAANEFGDGALLDVEAVATTAFADGKVGMYILIEPLL